MNRWKIIEKSISNGTFISGKQTVVVFVSKGGDNALGDILLKDKSTYWISGATSGDIITKVGTYLQYCDAMVFNSPKEAKEYVTLKLKQPNAKKTYKGNSYKSIKYVTGDEIATVMKKNKSDWEYSQTQTLGNTSSQYD